MKLSTNETICLLWMSRCKSLDDVAAIEGESAHEIQLRLNTALRFLDVASISEAIEKAKSLKLI